MRLGEVFEGCEVKNYNAEIEICGVTSDSRKVKPGYLFICLAGTRHDGHDYVEEAVRRGAVCILGEHSTKSPIGTSITPCTRSAESKIWYNFTGRPTDKMKRIAVTGTSGKSSVVFLLRHLFRSAGLKVGVITTLGAYSEDRMISLGENGGSSVTDLAGAMTTPDPEFFFGAACEMAKDGCDMFIYEASSQAIALGKLSAISPNMAVFTNLSREHLDFHQTMEEYFNAKSGLMRGAHAAVINCDDEWIGRLYGQYPNIPIIRCTAQSEKISDSDVCAIRIGHTNDGSEYVYFSEKAVFRVKTPQIGRFSVYNTMEAAACAIYFGCDAMMVKDALASFGGVRGRMYRVYEGDGLPCVIIDYAHTPNALKAVLGAVREWKKDGRLIVMFGCGGDRDRGKRPLMAKAAQELADLVVITSDNPRTEDPMAIISDIVCGMDGSKPYIVIPDRREAICYVIEEACAEDTVILAGKGHEDYEITSDGKHPFDEEKCAREALREKIMKNKN